MKILTFDIEDWFHILDNPETKGTNEWLNFESRINQNMDTIFSILSNRNQKATFFIVGWLADKHPHIVKKIVNNGYEIGSHTHLHQLVYEQKPKDFEADLYRSVNVLEEISGQKVKYFRAPGFSITSATPWAFESLIKNGIEIDSSVFPASRAHGGFTGFGSVKPTIIETKGMTLKEFPINTHSLFGKELIYSGGGYFRLFPYQLINHFSSQDDYIMTYFHPRDFDPNQPLVPGLNLVRKFKSYYGLKSTRTKLSKWLNDFQFVDLATADKSVDWSRTKKITI